jgi:hypothetical protein
VCTAVQHVSERFVAFRPELEYLNLMDVTVWRTETSFGSQRRGHHNMRIAFVSCICRQVFDDQPVWDWIRDQVPDKLVLLGDSVYLDIKTSEHRRTWTISPSPGTPTNATWNL